MQRKTYLAKNTALFAINSIGTRLITFLLVPLYTKVFVTAEYGGVDLVTTIATIFVPIITINIGEAVMRFSLDEDADSKNIINIGILFSCLSIALGTTVFLVLRLFPQISANPGIIYLFCISQGIYQTMSCILRGQEKLLHYAVGNIIATFSAAIMNIVFLVILKLGINGYFLAYTLSFVLGSIYCAIKSHALSAVSFRNIDHDLLKKMVKYSIVLVPNSLMWWVMNSSDHIMVTGMIGIAANGIYAISYKIPSILSSLSTVFNQAWAYSAIHEDKSKDKVEFHNTMYDKLVRFQLIITIILMCIIRPLMKIYVDSAYFEAWKYTPYLLTGYFFLTMGTFLSTFYTVNKDSRGFLFSGSAGAIINIVLNWILIPYIGIHGAALATCVSYICVFLYRVRDTRKYIKVAVFKKEYVIGYIILLVSAVSMFLSEVVGQSVLIANTIVIMILYRNFIMECISICRKVINKLIRK